MKRVISVLALVLVLSLPGMAAAQGSGMYLAPKFLLSIQDSGKMERSFGMSGSGVSEYSQFTMGGALALGYDFWIQHMMPLRAEIEFAMRGNSEKTWSSDNIFSNLGSVKGTWNNSTLFANVFWDFHNDSALTPYVGAGLGLAFNYTGFDFAKVNGDRFSASQTSTNFAWNAGVGVAYQFTENVALDASYRFVSMGFNEVSATSGGVTYKLGSSPYNNEFMVGVRFGF